MDKRILKNGRVIERKGRPLLKNKLDKKQHKTKHVHTLM